MGGALGPAEHELGPEQHVSKPLQAALVLAHLDLHVQHGELRRRNRVRIRTTLGMARDRQNQQVEVELLLERQGPHDHDANRERSSPRRNLEAQTSVRADLWRGMEAKVPWQVTTSCARLTTTKQASHQGLWGTWAWDRNSRNQWRWCAAQELREWVT